MRRSTDVVSLLSLHTALKPIAAGEWCGPCPRCGGTDRLHARSDGRWFCRRCHERWGDAIELVRWLGDLSFHEALDRLDGGATLPVPGTPRQAERKTAPRRDPDRDWRERAGRLVDDAAARLWTDTGARARAWLNDRGLSDDTLRRHRIGYIAADGISHGHRSDRGIVIPRFPVGDELPVFINVRRPVGMPKYRAVAGGQPTCYAVSPTAHPIVVLTEGEFDALLVAQVCGDLVAVATLGSATIAPDANAAAHLSRYRRILVAFDGDDAGRNGTARLQTFSKRVRVARLPDGLDLTDLHTRGGNLRAWIGFHVDRLDLEMTPAPQLAESPAAHTQPRQVVRL